MSQHRSLAPAFLLGTLLLLPGCSLTKLAQLGVFNPAQATAAQRVAGEPSTEPALLARYSVVEDTESWNTVLYGDRDFAKLEAFITSSLQRERTDELASAYLNRLYGSLATLPAHSDYAHTEADDQQLTESLAVLDQWIARFPDSHIPYVIRSNLLSNHGWQIRGGALAYRVPDEAWPPFLQFMEQAKADLDRAAALNPDDPNVWASLLDVARGLSLPEQVWEDYFERGLAANPYNINVWGKKSILLEPKWLGSEARMLQLAQECDRLSKSANKPLLAVVALSIHRSLDQAQEGYLNQPAVWREIEATYARIFAAYPDNQRMRYYYAYDAAMAQQWPVAAEQFEIIGDRWTRGTPWRSLEHYHTGRTAAFYELAAAAYDQQRYQQAETLALQAIGLKPNPPSYLILGAVQAAYHGNMPGVIEYAEQALANTPTPAEQQYAEDLIRQAEAHLSGK